MARCGRGFWPRRASKPNATVDAEECAALEQIDRGGLELAARSFAHKRALKGRSARSWWWKYVGTALRRPGS